MFYERRNDNELPQIRDKFIMGMLDACWMRCSKSLEISLLEDFHSPEQSFSIRISILKFVSLL